MFDVFYRQGYKDVGARGRKCGPGVVGEGAGIHSTSSKVLVAVGKSGQQRDKNVAVGSATPKGFVRARATVVACSNEYAHTHIYIYIHTRIHIYI